MDDSERAVIEHEAPESPDLVDDDLVEEDEEEAPPEPRLLASEHHPLRRLYSTPGNQTPKRLQRSGTLSGCISRA